MSKSSLKVIKRDLKKKEEEQIPAVLYGRGVKNKNLWVDKKEFIKIYKMVGGSTLIDILFEEDKDKRSVLVYDVQVHPLTGDFVHIDFFQVDMNEKIETDIELVFGGISLAVKELGGTLVKSLDKLTVRCLPGDLVNHIKVDISIIKSFDDYIHIKDLEIPKGIEVTLEKSIVVALVTPPRTNAEMEKLKNIHDGDISKVDLNRAGTPLLEIVSEPEIQSSTEAVLYLKTYTH